MAKDKSEKKDKKRKETKEVTETVTKSVEVGEDVDMDDMEVAKVSSLPLRSLWVVTRLCRWRKK